MNSQRAQISNEFRELSRKETKFIVVKIYSGQGLVEIHRQTRVFDLRRGASQAPASASNLCPLQKAPKLVKIRVIRCEN